MKNDFVSINTEGLALYEEAFEREEFSVLVILGTEEHQPR